MIRVAIDALAPDQASIERVARVIRAGGVVAIPTETLYGLAADPYTPRAVRRVFSAKGRPSDRALPLVAADALQVTRWLGDLPASGRLLANAFWPGPLTLIIAASPQLAPEATAAGATIGVRVPAHAVTRALAAACGHPLTATSANKSGQPATPDPDEVYRQMGDDIDALLDAGSTPGGLPSTMVDVTGPDPVLVRAGAVAWEEIQRCLQRG